MKKHTKQLLTVGGLALGAYALLRQPATAPRNAAQHEIGELVPKESPATYLARARRILTSLNSYVDQAVQLTDVPKWLLLGIAIKEIGDFPFNSINKTLKKAMDLRPRGIVQMDSATAVDTLYFAKRNGLLTPAVMALLSRKLGASLPAVLAASNARSPAGSKYWSKPLLDPEVGLLMGGLMLRNNMIAYTENGTVNMAKVAVGYNQGYNAYKGKFGKAGLNSPQLAFASADTLVRHAPTGEAKDYLVQTMGRGGIFDTLRTTGM